MIDPKRAYWSQRRIAAHRGIDFKLTFDEWMEFWGEDLARRGVGRDKLQMQRLGDVGAYELGNMQKGFPRQNSRTAAVMKRNRDGLRCAAEHQASLDRVMREESADHRVDEEKTSLTSVTPAPKCG